MNTTDWQSFHGQVLSERFRIGPLLQGNGSSAFFRVDDLESREELLLRVEDASRASSDDELNRFREACYLRHPNLLRAIAAGQAEFSQNKFIYLITEMVEVDLAERLQSEPLSLSDIADLLRQLVSGLKYIHSENFVYCALRAGFIWRVGSEWKLADFSQLRVEGKYAPEETRRLLLMPSFECPPEANVGVVSDAWDSWSLGSVLRKVTFSFLSQREESLHPGKPVSLNRLAIPAPFDHILGTCLDPDPASRAGLQEILDALSATPQTNSEPEGGLAANAPAPDDAAFDHPNNRDTTQETEPMLIPLVSQETNNPARIEHFATEMHPLNEPMIEPQVAAPAQPTNSRIPDPIAPTPQTFTPPAVAAATVRSPQVGRKSPARAVIGIIAASLAVITAVVFSNRVIDAQAVRGNSVSRPATVTAPPVAASVSSKQPKTAETATSDSTAEPSRHDPFGDPAKDAIDGNAAGVNAQAQIVKLLNQWVSATRVRDVDQEVNCYAPVVETFYGQRKVSATRLRTQEKDVFARIGKVRKFEITKVHFSSIGKDSAVVSFDKNWEFGDRGRFAGSARDEVVVRPVRGQWKIASQREIKLYWVNKQQTAETGA